MIADSHKNKLLYPLLLTAAAAGAMETEPVAFDTRFLTPDALVSAVLRENPGIAELDAAADAARHSVDPAGSFDDPEFLYGFAPRTFGREGQGLNQRIELSQKIPWPGTIAAREQAAQSSMVAAHDDVDAMRLHVAALASGAFAEWYFTHRALEIHHSTHELLDELHAVAETRYVAGRALQQDVLQVELQQLHLQRHGLMLEQQKTAARARINALLNRPPETEVRAPGPISIPKDITPLETLEERALNEHPEIHGLAARVASQQARVTVAEKALLPDLRFMVGYNSLWDEVDKRPIVAVSINVPLNRSKRRSEVDRATAEVRRMQSRLANQRAQILGELARAHAKVLESIESVQLYEDSLLPLADEFLDAALADYQSGQGDFLSVIAAEQHRLTAAEELERNRADYLIRSAELDRWTGMNLNAAPPAGTEVNHVN